MLKVIIEKETDIPEGLKDHYKERDGKWELQAEGMKTQTDIDKLKEAAKKEREDHDETKKSLKAKTTELGTVTDELEVLKKSGGEKDDREPTHAELLELAKLRRENKTLTDEHEELKTKHETLNTSVTTNTVKDQLRKAFKGKIREEAVEDQIENALRNFVLSEGKALTNHDLGDKGGLTADEFADNLLKAQSYLAPPSNSGGARGGSTRVPSESGKGESAKDHYENILGGKS
jgi:hypothetical protein